MEVSPATSPRPPATWPIAIAVPGVAAAVAVILLFIEGPWMWRVIAAVLSVAGVGVLIYGDRLLRGRIRELWAGVEDHERRMEEVRDTLKSREADIGRLQGDLKRRTTAWDAERLDLDTRLRQATGDLATNRTELETLQAAWAQLREQNGTLSAERADALQRRQLLQAQYQDLEVTSRQLGASHAERSAQYREALDSAGQVRSELERLRVSESTLTTEAQKLRHQVERLDQERRSFDFRERALREEVETLRRNLAEAKSTAQAATTQRALTEELTSRRAELDRLSEELAHQREQSRLAVSRAELAERAREEVAAQLSRLQERLEATDVVIGELQDEVRNVSKESKSDLAQHFVWRLNYFENDEIRLNFTNDGPAVDLVALRCEPALPCAFEGERAVARGGEGTVVVRPVRPAKAPDEFRLTIRYTIRSQDAGFRIRPYSANKIERL